MAISCILHSFAFLGRVLGLDRTDIYVAFHMKTNIQMNFQATKKYFLGIHWHCHPFQNGF